MHTYIHTYIHSFIHTYIQLNQLQLLLRAWRDGFSHVLVLEDDVRLAPPFAADLLYARQVPR